MTRRVGSFFSIFPPPKLKIMRFEVTTYAITNGMDIYYVWTIITKDDSCTFKKMNGFNTFFVSGSFWPYFFGWI